MNKLKGFTLTELIVSFALLSIISLALFRTVLTLQRMQRQNVFQNEFKALTILLNNEIQNDFNNEEITNVLGCGTNCYNIVYKNKGTIRLSIDTLNNVITYGDIKEKLPEEYTLYSDLRMRQYESDTPGFNSYITITIPIKSNYDANLYGLKYMYMYDSTGEYQFYIPDGKPNRKCTFDGEMVVGATFIDGQYTYQYKKNFNGDAGWVNMVTDGWGVKLTDPNSTAPITTKICTSINNKYVTSYSYLFSHSKSIHIDLSSFNTSHVNYMGRMFYDTSAPFLDLTDFDTSNVTNMWDMFYMNKSTRIIGLDSFDTSNVVSMLGMFNSTIATTLDLSNFDTSNVTNMAGMFASSKVEVLDLTNFDTSKVISTKWMFSNASVRTIYVKDLFVTTSITDSEDMFWNALNLVGGMGSVYDVNKTDKTYAIVDQGVNGYGYFTYKD